MREPPGTLAVIEPDSAGALASGDDDGPVLDAHSMNPEVVLATLARLGGHVDQVYVVGCQPACLDEGMGLSPPVAGAVERAVELCRQLMIEIVQPIGKGTSR